MAHDTFTRDGFLFYETDFIALNNSGVEGRVLAFVDEHAKSVTFNIKAMGLVPDQVHPQHVHGFPDDTDSKTPNIKQDKDGDGFVELAEGAATYGPVQLNLTTQPGDAAQLTGMAAAFPMADADGMLSYRQTFSFAELGMESKAVFGDISPLEAKEIVLHGLDLAYDQGGNGGEADGSAGYKAVLPVAAGELRGIAAAGDVVEAVAELGLDKNQILDKEAIAQQVLADYDATGSWFLREDRKDFSDRFKEKDGSGDDFLNKGFGLYETSFIALNNSGVEGRVLAVVDEDAKSVTFDIKAMGLVPDQVHPQHVHGFPDDTDSKTPNIKQDKDGDGFVELAEGAATYGPVQLNLTTQPGDAAQLTGMAAAFPMADADGMLSYRQTFSFAELGMESKAVFGDISPLEAKEIVLHGLDLAYGQGGNGGEADGSAGYKAVLPVAAGELRQVMGAQAVVDAVDELDMFGAGMIDWQAVTAEYAANPLPTDTWYA